MFGFIRRIFRPVASIGQKLGEVFSIGRKSNAVRVLREPVIEGERVMRNEKFMKVPLFEGGKLRPFDEMGRDGGFRGFTPSYPLG